MYYPEFFETLTKNSSDAPPPPLPGRMLFTKSQETVATIGSLAGDFLDIMNSKTVDSIPPLRMLQSTDSINIIEFDSNDEKFLLADLPLSSQDFAAEPSLPPLEPCVSDSSSVGSSTSEALSPLVVTRPTTKRTVHKAKKSLTKPSSAPKRIRKVYDIAVDCRRYVQYTDSDVLCQRGGLANKHKGNHQYLAAKEALQTVYQATPKSGRTAVAQQLVDRVHAWGGRFLRKDAKGWYEIHNHTARTKAGQALREEYTPEERKEKRDRYKSLTTAFVSPESVSSENFVVAC